MRSFGLLIFFSTYCWTYAHYHGNSQNDHTLREYVYRDPTTREVHYGPGKRLKREAVGTLNIVTNNGQPIHADVKSEQDKSSAGATGVIDQVTPPKEVSFEGKSLRKSWPLTSRLDLIRSLARMITLAVLVLSGAIEFYPLIRHLYYLYYV